MQSKLVKIFLGIASFGSLIALALVVALLVTFERASDEALTIGWVLFICFFVIGRVMRGYFNSMVKRGEVEERDRQFWLEKAKFLGPLAAPTFWWRAIWRSRERNILPEDYRPQ